MLQYVVRRRPIDSLLAVIREGLDVPPNFGMIVDVVDEQNRVIAQAQRDLLFREHLNFRTVNVLVFRRDGRLILQHLIANHSRSPNRLGASAAGYLYAGESYGDAATRKLREELRLTVDPREMGQIEMLDEGSRKFVGIFTAIAEKRPIIADDQIAELVYMRTQEIDSLMSVNPRLFTSTFVLVYDQFKRWTATH